MAIKKKGLILYASVTGNTEKVAKAFGKAFETCGWSYDLVKITAKTSFKKDPVYFDDYDFVCLGSPIAWLMADAFLIPAYFHVSKVLQKRMVPQTDVPQAV